MGAVLVDADRDKLQSLPDRSFFLDCIYLQGGLAATNDFYKDGLRALAILACACVGHSGTPAATGEGFYVTMTASPAVVRNFLDLKGEIAAPIYFAGNSPQNIVRRLLIEIKRMYTYDFRQFYYMVLLQTTEDGGQDIKIKQVPRHPNVVLGRDAENLDKSLRILQPYVENMSSDKSNVIPSLMASAVYARSKCPFEG